MNRQKWGQWSYSDSNSYLTHFHWDSSIVHCDAVRSGNKRVYKPAPHIQFNSSIEKIIDKEDEPSARNFALLFPHQQSGFFPLPNINVQHFWYMKHYQNFKPNCICFFCQHQDQILFRHCNALPVSPTPPSPTPPLQAFNLNQTILMQIL